MSWLIVNRAAACTPGFNMDRYRKIWMYVAVCVCVCVYLYLLVERLKARSHQWVLNTTLH